MEDVRDIVIIVFGIGATVATVVLLAMALLLYRKVSAAIESARNTITGVEAFSRDILEPVTRASGFFATALRVLSSLLGQRKNESGGTGDGK